MRFTKKQRENLAKFLFDSAKLILAINILSPIVVKNIPVFKIVTGIVLISIIVLFALILDREEKIWADMTLHLFLPPA